MEQKTILIALLIIFIISIIVYVSSKKDKFDDRYPMSNVAPDLRYLVTPLGFRDKLASNGSVLPDFADQSTRKPISLVKVDSEHNAVTNRSAKEDGVNWRPIDVENWADSAEITTTDRYKLNPQPETRSIWSKWRRDRHRGDEVGPPI